MVVTDSTRKEKLNIKEKRYLIDLARRSMMFYLENHDMLEPGSIPEKMKKKHATFVSLYVEGNLRGCIGTLYTTNPLYKDIIHNAASAAFLDDRFTQLTSDEIKGCKIEISILSEPERIEFRSADDLLKRIKPNEDGIIIAKENRKATFLPQVWEHFSSKEEFFSHLCMKAGLQPEEWKKPGMDVLRYHTEVFSS